MPRLFSIIYSLASTVLAGSALVFVLEAGWVSGVAIVAALATGAVVAVPVDWVIAQELDR
ncbi:MAG: hypothetical protein AAFU80_16910 [Pseudomonadota bacterium]